MIKEYNLNYNSWEFMFDLENSVLILLVAGYLVSEILRQSLMVTSELTQKVPEWLVEVLL